MGERVRAVELAAYYNYLKKSSIYLFRMIYTTIPTFSFTWCIVIISEIHYETMDYKHVQPNLIDILVTSYKNSLTQNLLHPKINFKP